MLALVGALGAPGGKAMFVVCGEALMDVFTSGETATGVALDARIGGSPFNVAVGLARLGQAVAFCGGLSSGLLGRRLRRALSDEGVATGCAPALDAPTTLSLVELDERGVPAYAFYGTGGADRLLPRSALDAVPVAARAFHFGSYAMVVEPVAEGDEHARRGAMARLSHGHPAAGASRNSGRHGARIRQGHRRIRRNHYFCLQHSGRNPDHLRGNLFTDTNAGR